MFPDGVETITMTKEDYDRNVEQLLFDKVNAELKLENIKKYIGIIHKNENISTKTMLILNDILLIINGMSDIVDRLKEDENDTK